MPRQARRPAPGTAAARNGDPRATQHITAEPDRITQITRAALVLTQFEHKYIS